MRRNTLMVALLVLAGAPAAAQQSGTLEIGGFGKWTHFDKSFNGTSKDATGWGGGGRLGLFFSPHWELEADGSGSQASVDNFFKGFTGLSLTYFPFHVRLNYNKRLGGEDGGLSWLIGAGPAYNRYGRDPVGIVPGFKGQDWGISAITGLRLNVWHGFALRVDGTVDFIPKPSNGKSAIVSQPPGISASFPPSRNINLGAQGGVSLMLGLCSRSADGTTVLPATATMQIGQSVDLAGRATNCGRPDEVVFTVSGPGTVDASGRFTSAGAGAATVTACGRKNEICSTAAITVTTPPPAPAPQPPTQRTLVRCELTGPQELRVDRPVTYSATCYYSDGTTETVSVTGLAAPDARTVDNSLIFMTPGTRNVTVTLPGGRTLTSMVEVQGIHFVVQDSAYFAKDKTVIYRGEDQSRLNEIAQTLKAHPDIKLTIDGHADADGTVKYNERLAMNRAISLKNYLASQGVPVDRMTIVLRSFGECVPVAPNNTAEGRAKNRRAELTEFGNSTPGEGNAKCKEAGRGRAP